MMNDVDGIIVLKLAACHFTALFPVLIRIEMYIKYVKHVRRPRYCITCCILWCVRNMQIAHHQSHVVLNKVCYIFVTETSRWMLKHQIYKWSRAKVMGNDPIETIKSMHKHKWCNFN